MVDEAGECTITEALVPLQVVSERTKVIFSGDWKQLGPLIRSKVCLDCEFDQSVVEKC